MLYQLVFGQEPQADLRIISILYQQNIIITINDDSDKEYNLKFNNSNEANLESNNSNKSDLEFNNLNED
ncbi:9781_t:CDS:2 [Racocetra persica]|uniref:9781_t:CDS:1 n=1 Tax=Racocetra persica TaxID=160502 RepID=A0ACA9KLB5_9GLOM|nr:9781_t:CDS:2 [Racocetra persica]